MKTSPDFDESLMIVPPAKKICKQKASIKKEWECLLKDIHQLLLSTFCFDTTNSKVTEHPKFEVRDFS